MAYRFACRHCESRFSLEVQRDQHEEDCGKMGTAQKGLAVKPSRAIPCKRCRAAGVDATFAHIKDVMAHIREVHGADFKAKHTEGIRRRARELKKIDAAVRGEASAGASHAKGGIKKTTRSEPAPNGHLCPLCGGDLPATTAQLVAELTGMGISEAQAFEAARIARRVLGPATTARA